MESCLDINWEVYKQGLRTKTDIQLQSCLCGFDPINVAEDIQRARQENGPRTSIISSGGGCNGLGN